MKPQLALTLALSSALALVAAGPAGAANVDVDVINFSFDPATVHIQVGDSVTWTNRDIGITHNVVANDGSFRCANGCDGQPGGKGGPNSSAWSATLVFTAPGTFPYHCQIHGLAMSGTVVVTGAASNPGAIRFSSTSYTITEGSAHANVTVQRVSGDDGAASVHYATSNGSAVAGNDYTATSGNLSWADHDSGNKTFAVPIINDSTPEGNESVNLALSNVTGAALASPSTATLTIVDNDSAGPAGTLSFTAAEQSVAEGAGSATAAVQRTGGSNGAVSVAFTAGDGSATAGDDYIPVAGTVSFADGDAANKTFLVPILDDALIENNETINLMLSSPTGGAVLGSPAAQTLTVLDDDVPTGPCVDDEFTLCLHDNRFRVTVDFRRPSDSTPQHAHRIPFTERAGMFWFFNEANIEMLIKVQNACVEPFNRYWVFFAATTNVEFTLTVVDTQAQMAKVYTNPQGMAALPIQDTGAFATCP